MSATETKTRNDKKDAAAAVNDGQDNTLATVSLSFVQKVERQFAAELGQGIKWTPLQSTLAQHLFIRINEALNAAEAKRLEKNEQRAPYIWASVNMPRLSIDSVHRINLGLDALIKNHISPVFYWNKRISKYDIDLFIGFMGKDHVHRTLALNPPKDINYFLVHETDHFVPHMRSRTNPVESYEFEIKNPFNRGKAIGGAGYISFDDPTMNRLILVDERDFQRSKKASKGMGFWGDENSEEEMRFKTVVHRTTEKIPLDPEKVNAVSWMVIQAQQDAILEAEITAEVEENANKEQLSLSAPSESSENLPDAPSQEEVPADLEKAAGF